MSRARRQQRKRARRWRPYVSWLNRLWWEYGNRVELDIKTDVTGRRAWEYVAPERPKVPERARKGKR